MSYIKHKERVFNCKNNGVELKRRKRRPTTVNPCTDSRAWSLSQDDKREFFIDITSNPGFDNTFVPPEVIIDILMSQKNEIIKELLEDNGKEISKETLVNENYRTDGLDKRPNKTDASTNTEPHNNQNQCNIEYLNIESEGVNNMKNLIKDLREQIFYLESVKAENITLRGELEVDLKAKLSDALAENNHLSAELDACSGLVEKYTNLTQVHKTLVNECQELSAALNELQTTNLNLENQLKEEKDKLDAIKEQKLAITTAVAERDILVGKLNSRDEKIQFLTTIIEDQERQIHDLTWQLQRLSQNFSSKEAKLMKNLEETKESVQKKSQKLLDYEIKLESSEMLIRELETLGNQFRITNANLTESNNYYKHQFHRISKTSIQMIGKLTEMQSDILKKDEEIKKLSLFPQTSKTIIYFSQLNGLLSKSNITEDSDLNDVKELVGSIKHLVSQLKVDVWGDKEMPTAFEICDAFNQTIIETNDEVSQSDIMEIEEKCVQTNFDDFGQMHNALQQVQNLNNNIDLLQKNLFNEQHKCHLLEQKLIKCLEAKALCESEVATLQDSNSKLKEKILKLNKKLDHSDKLLADALDEIQNDITARESTSEIFEQTLEKTLGEYKKYTSSLENYIDIKEKTIENFNLHVDKTINTFSVMVEDLERKLEVNSIDLKKEKAKNELLVSQIRNLEGEYFLKENYCNILKEKLNEAEVVTYESEHLLGISNNKMGEEYIQTEGDNKQIQQVTKILKLLVFQNVILKENIDQKSYLSLEIDKLTNSNNFLKRVLRNDKMQKKNLKRKVIQLRANLRRIKRFIFKLQQTLKIKDSNNYNFQIINKKLTEQNQHLKIENDNLLKNIEILNTKVSDLGTSLEIQEIKDIEYNEGKEKLERALTKILKKMQKYKQRLSAEEENKVRDKDEIIILKQNIIELQKLNLELTSEINCLTSDLMQAQMSENKNKKLETRDIDVQVDIKDNLEENCRHIIDNIKNEYELMMEELKKNYSQEKEEINKQSIVNLNTLKETYERDINRLKRSHSENLTKLQLLHEEEIKYLKEMKDESQLNVASIEENYNRKLEALNNNFLETLREEKEAKEQEKKLLKEELERFFENEYKMKIDTIENDFNEKLKSQEAVLRSEKEILKQEMEEVISNKDSKIIYLEEKMTTTVENMKQKCKQYIKKSNEHHRSNIEKIKSELMDKYEHQKKHEIRKKKINALTITKTEQFEVLDLPIKDCSSMDNLTQNLKYELNKSTELDDIILAKLEATNSIMGYEIPTSYTMIQDSRKKYNKMLELIPTKGNQSEDDPLKSSLLWDKKYLSTQIATLETELLMKNHELEKNVSLLEKRIREEHLKRVEVSSLLDFELKHSAEVQKRLGIEFERAEMLHSEKDTLQRHAANLEKKLHQAMEMVQTERVKYHSLKLQLENTLAEQNNIRELESSLARLRTKLDKASECEKRLSDELSMEREKRKELEIIIKDKYNSDKTEEIQKVKNPQNDNTDLKVIFIKQCGILHTWSRQVIKQKN